MGHTLPDPIKVSSEQGVEHGGTVASFQVRNFFDDVTYKRKHKESVKGSGARNLVGQWFEALSAVLQSSVLNMYEMQIQDTNEGQISINPCLRCSHCFVLKG